MKPESPQKRWLALLVLLIPGLPGEGANSPTQGPSRQAVIAFDQYIRAAESRLQIQSPAQDRYLWANTPERRQRVRHGAVVCEPGGSRSETNVPGALIHDWVGAVFIPHATVEQVLAVVQDYDHHKNIYKPEVIDSRTLERHGDDFKIRLRLVQHKVITVVLDTEHEVHYHQEGPGWWRSRSYSTHIAEIEDYGTPHERERPPGQDRGFLWRLNSYWSFREGDGGTYVECEAISLTRSVPAGLRWLIEPIVRGLARDSLVHTLASTQAAVLRLTTSPANTPGS
jgi:hypothetical protein